MRRSLALIMAASALAQLAIAWRFYGFLTGDEVEMLSEAFRVATNYDYGLWDVRNRFVAHVFVAPPVFIASLLGARDPLTLVRPAILPFIALTTFTIWLVHRLALRWTGAARAALVAAALFAAHWLPLGFGGTTYPRVLSMCCITAAALLVAQERRAFDLAAGALAALAFADRYSEIVFLLPLLLLARRRAWHVAAGFVAGALLLAGAYDWLTWGEPFHSLRRFAAVTLVERDFSSRIKTQSPLWYLETLPRWCALTLLPFFARGRHREPWLFIAVPLVALSLVAHKELRYLQAVIPFVAIAAADGFARFERRRAAAVLLALSLVWNLAGLRFVARRSMPAVDAARWLGARPWLQRLAIGQLWAYGDRIFTGERRIIDVGSPPHDLAQALAQSDAAALYESDLTPDVRDALQRAGFTAVAVFQASRARDVVVFTASPATLHGQIRR
ncbi:MAG TPA: hypothetical protein VF824_07475 [Thermoanaerobaculia bacterium]|jgi:hypothetical protein